ncbi:MAG: hypothetical protein IPK16_28600, partial [Anaerolineales bacterium]|nr:hypothetical protein [Anaerolineales bacterium]
GLPISPCFPGDIDNNDIKTPPVLSPLPPISGATTSTVLWLDGVAGDVPNPTVIDGFTVTAGYPADGVGRGGGLYCSGESAAISAQSLACQW